MRRFSSVLVILAALVFWGCGSGGDSDSSSGATWVSITSATADGGTANISGTAWVSNSWVGLHCAGLACLFDTSTNNYPGVNVSWYNQATGQSGTATSYYGGGTGWVHQWQTAVPLASGTNRIEITALDPDGKGGSTTATLFSP